MAEARKLGLPLTPKDIQTSPIEDSQNGAVIVDQVVQMLKSNQDDQKRLDLVAKAGQSGSTSIDRSTAILVFPHLKAEMDLLVSATERATCRFSIDWTHIFTSDDKPITIIQDFIYAFCLQADELSSQGDTKGALTAIQNSDKLCRLLSGNPLRVTAAVELRCDLEVERCFHRILVSHRRDVDFLSSAQKAHAAFGPIPDYRFAFKTQLLFALMYIEQLSSARAAGIGQQDMSEDEWNAVTTQDEKDIMKEHSLAAYIAFFSVLPEGNDRWPTIIEIADHAFENLKASSSELTKGALRQLNGIDLFGWDFIVAGYARDQGMRRMNDVSIHLLLDISKTGRAPDGLPDYGDIITDPFTGHRLEYEPSGKGFKLSTAGISPLPGGGEYKPDIFSFDES